MGADAITAMRGTKNKTIFEWGHQKYQGGMTISAATDTSALKCTVMTHFKTLAKHIDLF